MGTTNIMPALAALRDRLASVSGVATCKIGLEANMTPADYPMVRIVPSLARHASVLGRRQVECLVYFGQPVHEFEQGLEALYSDLFAMESTLIDTAETTPDIGVEYRETIADEDRVDGYKLMALRLVVEG